MNGAFLRDQGSVSNPLIRQNVHIMFFFSFFFSFFCDGRRDVGKRRKRDGVKWIIKMKEDTAGWTTQVLSVLTFSWGFLRETIKLTIPPNVCSLPSLINKSSDLKLCWYHLFCLGRVTAAKKPKLCLFFLRFLSLSLSESKRNRTFFFLIPHRARTSQIKPAATKCRCSTKYLILNHTFCRTLRRRVGGGIVWTGERGGKGGSHNGDSRFSLAGVATLYNKTSRR